MAVKMTPKEPTRLPVEFKHRELSNEEFWEGVYQLIGLYLALGSPLIVTFFIIGLIVGRMSI